MHVEANGTAKFEVKDTGEIVEVSANELEWGCEGNGERQMGSELVHTAEFEIAGHIVAWRVWEYPVGSENHKETECSSCLNKLQDISYHLEYDQDSDVQE